MAEDAVIFYRGYFEDEWELLLREGRVPESAEDYAQRLRDAHSWAMTRGNALYRFWLMVKDLADTTEIGEVAAIAFLLADAPVRLPRLAYRSRLRWGGKNPGVSITLSIYDLGVEPSEVERAYRRIRSELLAGRILPTSGRESRQRNRKPSERTLAMLAFCRDRKATQKFPRICNDWNKTHKEVWEYGDGKSLYNAYRVAEGRWGVERDRERKAP